MVLLDGKWEPWTYISDLKLLNEKMDEQIEVLEKTIRLNEVEIKRAQSFIRERDNYGT